MKPIILVLAVLFIGCSNENPVEPTSLPSSPSLTGRWAVTVIADTGNVTLEFIMQQKDSSLTIQVFNSIHHRAKKQIFLFVGSIRNNCINVNGNISTPYPQTHQIFGACDPSMSSFFAFWNWVLTYPTREFGTFTIIGQKKISPFV